MAENGTERRWELRNVDGGAPFVNGPALGLYERVSVVEEGSEAKRIAEWFREYARTAPAGHAITSRWAADVIEREFGR